jgi:hypothetical protein
VGGDEVQTAELLALRDGGNWLGKVSNLTGIQPLMALTAAIVVFQSKMELSRRECWGGREE